MWCNPVGDQNNRSYPPFPWRVTNPFLAWYALNGASWVYHTGNDIDLPGSQDVGQEIRAVHDGIVIYAAYLPTTTWLGLVVIEHEWQGHKLYTRYAHLKNSFPKKKGAAVKTGDVIGFSAETAGTVARFPPHLHFDMSKLDDDTMKRNPTNWPGAAKAGVADHYQDPIPFMRARLAEDDEGGEVPVTLIMQEFKVITTVNLSLREWPDVNSTRLTQIPPGYKVTASKQVKVSEDGLVWTYAKWNGWRGWCAVADQSGKPWLEGFL